MRRSGARRRRGRSKWASMPSLRDGPRESVCAGIGGGGGRCAVEHGYREALARRQAAGVDDGHCKGRFAGDPGPHRERGAAGGRRGHLAVARRDLDLQHVAVGVVEVAGEVERRRLALVEGLRGNGVGYGRRPVGDSDREALGGRQPIQVGRRYGDHGFALGKGRQDERGVAGGDLRARLRPRWRRRPPRSAGSPSGSVKWSVRSTVSASLL